MNKSLLLVDDEEFNLDALERLFRKDFQIFRANSGKKALQIVKEQPVSVIISDQRMPEMTGVEFLHASQEFQADCSKILLTGYTDLEDIIDAINLGHIYQYVNKPWDSNELRVIVNKAHEHCQLKRDLEQKNKELESLDQAKNHFMLLVNHELKTPLTAISSYLQMLKECKLDVEMQTYVSGLEKGYTRLDSLVKDTLLLVSAETGQYKVKKEKVDLDSLLVKIKAEMKERMLQKNQMWIQSKAGQIVSDRFILETCLRELIDNAVKYGRENSNIVIDVSERISVTNEGNSIPEDKIQNLTKAFFIDEDIMNHSQGTGLGLSLTNAFLKLLGSSLKIENVPSGVEVSFVLKSG